MATAEPTTLYKFREVRGSRMEWVRQILVENRLFFPAPATFNDPFDPRPRYVVKNTEKFKYAYARQAREHLGTKMDRESLALQVHKANPHALVQNVTRAITKEMKDESRMMCWSSRRDHILSWSLYAGGHTGVCIHFDRTRPPFWRAMEVRYQKEYLPIELPRTLEYSEHLIRMLCTKSEIWAHESEYRMIRLPPSMRDYSKYPELGLQWNGDFAIFPPECVTGVTVGAMISDTDQREIRKMVTERSTPSELWCARLHESEFALEFDRLG